MSILFICTVGGSCAPVVNAIRTNPHDCILFICSDKSEGTVDGSGTPCRTGRDEGSRPLPPIIVQAELNKSRYKKCILQDPDDLDGCYRRIKEKAVAVAADLGAGTDIIANYTGGTKTMTLALGLVAVSEKWQLQVNTGPRQDLIKITGGDVVVQMSSDGFQEDQLLERAKEAATRFDYVTITTLVTGFLARQTLPVSRRVFWNRVVNLARGFHAWDLFEHGEARDLLTPNGRYVSAYLPLLARLSRLTRDQLSVELVFDLLANAKRRAAQGQYDNAAARLYRATEMIGQVELGRTLAGEKSFIVDAPRPALPDLPADIREQYVAFTRENDRLLLGLRETFLLLAKMHNPVGLLYQENMNRMTSALKNRNESILAHGTKPVDRVQYRSMVTELQGFIIKAGELMKSGRGEITQFPLDINIHKLVEDDVENHESH